MRDWLLRLDRRLLQLITVFLSQEVVVSLLIVMQASICRAVTPFGHSSFHS